MRILIADDDPIARRILARAVRDNAHTCFAAADGVEAWEIFVEHRPDVVISDWMMPGMDGIDLCRRIRDHKDSAGYTYFILLSTLEGGEYAIKSMEAGADDFLAKPLDRLELTVRLTVANRIQGLHATLYAQRAELEVLNRKLFEDGRRDGLTGLGNRRRLDEDLERIQDSFDRYGHGFSVALCDIDNFKKYNDTFGHPMGDQALRSVGEVLGTVFRKSDGAYRYGGEEFLVVLADQGAADAGSAMERVRNAIEDLVIPHPVVPQGVVTMSVGVAQAVRYQDWEVLLERADSALYKAKHLGRNRVVVCVGPDEYIGVPATSGARPRSLSSLLATS
jgi:two-component system chemotaxis response regulator CheY